MRAAVSPSTPYARFNWRVTQAHFLAAVRCASVSALLIAAFLPAALRLAAVSALVIAAFLPAALRFLFTRSCFLVAAAFRPRLLVPGFTIPIPPYQVTFGGAPIVSMGISSERRSASDLVPEVFANRINGRLVAACRQASVDQLPHQAGTAVLKVIDVPLFHGCVYRTDK
jgi:hypothetical protein